MNTRRASMESRSSMSTANSSLVLSSTMTNVSINPTETFGQLQITTGADSDNLTPSLGTVQSAPADRPSNSSNTRTRSNVWKYFERVSDIPPLKATCLLCGAQLLTPNYATTSLKRHLYQRHCLEEFGSTGSTRETVAVANISKSVKAKLDALALDAIIQDGRTFGDLQKPGIHKLLEKMQPGMNQTVLVLCFVRDCG